MRVDGIKPAMGDVATLRLNYKERQQCTHLDYLDRQFNLRDGINGLHTIATLAHANE